jgi:hypothetical protein
LLCALACGRAPAQPTGPFDLRGAVVDPLAQPAKLTALVFVTTECPISNRYAPEVGRLSAHFAELGVKFFLVYPSRLDSVDEIREHLTQHGYSLPALRDPDGVLVKASKVQRTPEVALFAPGRTLLYSGRIDDRFVDFGRERLAPDSHDLEDALTAALAGGPVVPARRDAVGCTIAPR